jgi:hypothetical protein
LNLKCGVVFDLFFVGADVVPFVATDLDFFLSGFPLFLTEVFFFNSILIIT